MIALLLAGALCTVGGPMVRPVPSDSLVRLYQGGKTWEEFFRGARARRDTWEDNYRQGAADSALVARARAVPGEWRIVAVAEDWCGDSANTVPYLVRLAEAVPAISVRIANSTDGRWLMQRHPTPDGRAATPTIVVIGADGGERGCFIERPAKLRAWVAENRPKLADGDFQDAKAAWYRQDRGRETVTEIIGLLEAAAAGSPRCP